MGNKKDDKGIDSESLSESLGDVHSMDQVHRRISNADATTLTAGPVLSTAWDRVKLSRHPDRPLTLDYVNAIFTEFVELHGDRRFAADPAIVAGFARFHG